MQAPRAINVFSTKLLPGVLLITWFLQGCYAEQQADVSAQIEHLSIETLEIERETPTPATRPGSNQPPTATAIPTSTETAVPTAHATPTPTLLPTVTYSPPVNCSERVPADDLLILVTLDYGLSREYEPADLVPLVDYLPQWSTLGYPTEIRQIIAEPLEIMVNNMRAAGLRPTIISGYRSYAAQAIAWNKWLELEPERASIISAPPGHSEHQLGTTVDFGSPELADIVGQEDIEFHTYFYQTSEGIWLENHAHEYGFVLSYPRNALEVTGFYYEPWHYRYVGQELATELKGKNLTLTEFLLEDQPVPCLPNPS